MAAAVEMGEVDDIHIKDDNVTEGVVMNGDISEGEKTTVVEEEKGDVELMEVDEPEDEPEVEEEPEKEDEETTENASTEDTANSVSDENSQDTMTHEEEDGGEHKEEEEEEEAVEEVEEPEIEKMEEDENDDSHDEVEAVAEVDESIEQEDDVITVIECNEDGDKAQADDEVEEVVDEVHAVDDNSDDDVQITKEEVTHVTPVKDSGCTKTVVLNDSNEVDDIMIVDSDVKENGTSTPEKPEVIDLDCTPVKKTPTSGKPASVTPRRSSRNLHKSKTYVDMRDTPSDESDIEEVIPQDPLADNLLQHQQLQHHQQSEKPKKRASSTIVVKDTKRLVEIASKSSPSNSGKKEPTLVIIDTNSILSGRGPVPISQKSSGQSSYSNLPVALPAQGVYPPNMRATITPIPMNTTSQKTTTTTSSSASVTLVPQQPPILPSLTDDMFVVEAPSFIVPYVYEKPPVKDLKDCIKTMADEIKKMLEEEEKRERENGEDKDDDIEEVPIVEDKKDEDKTKRHTYFDSPIGKFFVDIGNSLVQEYVQTDLLKQQKRKREREGGQNSATMKTIQSLLKSLEYTKENNQPYKMVMKKCEFCGYKTESSLAMAFHLETPHMKNFVYRCNFCAYEVRSPHDILYHMEGEHCVRGRLERAPAFHQCPNCPFEDNQKGKLSRHSVACARKFKPERNLEPPIDWEPPAKIPRAPRMKQQQSLTTTAAMYQAMAKSSSMNYMKMQQQQASIVQQTAMNRGRGRPSLPMPSKKQSQGSPQGLVYKQAVPGGASVLVPTNYQISGNQLYQNSSSKSKTVHQPSISITPLPRPSGGSGSSASSLSNSSLPGVAGAKPGDSNSKNSFVICEICDGYIKDLEQLRNHMQWIHKVKIHPKMIYNRPPLNCQKCQFRFFTDQGLERHLLGSHGLVTSSMQEAANKCKDSGRCPVCGRVYQWKLLNHVARDHSMTLKPAHLSYKCTVCTATFGMYKQFENHVYSAHSVVAKRSNDKKPVNSSPPSSKGESLLKPLKINDEITIIPQMPKSNGAGSSKDGHPSTSKNTPSTSKSRSLDKKEVPLAGSTIDSGEIQIINLG